MTEKERVTVDFDSQSYYLDGEYWESWDNYGEEMADAINKEFNKLSEENERLERKIQKVHGSLVNENEQLKEIINELNDENEQLKKDIEYLDEKIKENEWHWNTIDEDRDVWHYKCTQAKKRVKELKTENEQLKKENQKFKRIIDKLEMERCQYLNDKQAKSKWGKDYDKE